MNRTLVRCTLVTSLLPALLLCNGQAKPSTAASAATDAAWMRAFAEPFTPDARELGDENTLTNDARFDPLLKASFPQRQWFWYDHGRLVKTADLIETFTAVPGDAVLDDRRYVTADGCAPHACFIRGMLWVDTEAHPAALIFAGINVVGENGNRNVSHLWIFVSPGVNWHQLPPSFSTSLSRWISTIAKPGYNGTSGYSYNFALATVVRPNGVMEDIMPETLHLRPLEPGAKQ